MLIIKSISLQLGIFLLARLATDLDYQSIILFFIKFSENFKVKIWLAGFVVSVHSAFIFLSPIFGSFSDQFSRNTFLILGLVIFTLSSGLMIIAHDWIQVLVARVLAGLARAILIPSLLAELADRYFYEKRARVMGIVRLSWPFTLTSHFFPKKK